MQKKRLNTLDDDDISLIHTMSSTWRHFKQDRDDMKFEVRQGKGFLTILQREGMLDDLFEILIPGYLPSH